MNTELTLHPAMHATHILVAERLDRNNYSEGAQYLLFSEATLAEIFARRLASEYFDCGPLPDEGEFETPQLKGDVSRYEDELIISWTFQPRTLGGPLGDSHSLTVQPLMAYTATTRLDFWNQ